jgi:putative spermidine/putrescine transport system permease protein
MTDNTATGPNHSDSATPDNATRNADSGPMLAADGRPLKASLNRALRRQKLRALALIAPLLIFVLVAFIAPIADMLFRSVENQIVSDTIPRTTEALADWDGTTGEPPNEAVFEALYYDLFLAVEARQHTRLGSRLNYEQTGTSSLFRGTGRDVDDFGEAQVEALEDSADAWEDEAFWFALVDAGNGEVDSDLLDTRSAAYTALTGDRVPADIGFAPSAAFSAVLPRTAEAYTDFAILTVVEEEDVVAEEEPWESVKLSLVRELKAGADVATYSGPGAEELQAAAELAAGLDPFSFRPAFAAADEDWLSTEIWQTIQIYSPPFTSGYFLNSIDMEKGYDGPQMRDENQQIYLMLFWRTLVMSLTIMGACILLGYPVAWLLSNLPARTANLLMILVLLPFWTSLLVRTSAWKVMLQNQGVVNDTLVWLGLVADESRLALINNQTGTIIAMTHILLPFMILPLYSVMKTIPPSYLRAAKSLGATNWTAFWRVYFPQSVPGIGAGSILVFILAIGYYITPELVGGTSGIFISNRIAFHISSSLNWGLAAALGAILLVVVLALYYVYDKIVGIDNVKLGG